MKNLKELLKQITVLNELAEIRAEEVLTLCFGYERDYYYEGCTIFTTEELIGVIFENKDDSDCIELSIELLEMDEVEFKNHILQFKMDQEQKEKLREYEKLKKELGL